MIRICFICLGNICRSPMAEFIMKEKVRKLGLSSEFHIESRATSNEEKDNDIYPKAKVMLDKMNIPYTRHFAKKIESEDYSKFDYFFYMEDSNLVGIKRVFDDITKVYKLLDRDISDPWYTGDFISTFEDLDYGISLVINKLINKTWG